MQGSHGVLAVHVAHIVNQSIDSCVSVCLASKLHFWSFSELRCLVAKRLDNTSLDSTAEAIRVRAASATLPLPLLAVHLVGSVDILLTACSLMALSRLRFLSSSLSRLGSLATCSWIPFNSSRVGANAWCWLRVACCFLLLASCSASELRISLLGIS